MKLIAVLFLTAIAASAADALRVFDRAWTVPVASDWTVGQEDGSPVLRLVESRGPSPGPRRPIQFALADQPPYARITVETDLKALGDSLLIVFAYQDEAHFDYAHLSIDTAGKQPYHNGVFHVYGGERVRISSDRGPASLSGRGLWHHVKLTHDAASGAVDVTVDGRSVPALHAVDLSLGSGKAGVGSFDETGEFKNIRITTQ
jgi:hypothetical protein